MCCRFAHDKVREAAYLLNTEQEKVEIHYAVGIYLLNTGMYLFNAVHLQA